MTAESQTTGSIPPLPPWAYWLFVAFGAAIPSLLVAGVLPSPWDAVAAALGAVCAVMTGTNRPAAQAERVALAEAKKRAIERTRGPGAYGPGVGGIVGCLALCAFLLAGCLGLGLGSGGVEFEIGGVESAGEAEPGLSDECRDLDNAYMGLQITGTILAGVGGAGGAVLAIWPDPTRDELIGVGVATAGSGIIGAGLLLGAGMVAQRFVDRCTGGP